MYNERENQTIALAGVFQAAALVQQISWHGICDLNSSTASINSIFKIDSQSVIDVFGAVNNVNLGLNSLIQLFDRNTIVRNQPSKNQEYQEIARYTLSLIHLERKLIKEKKLLEIISKGIKRAKAQAEHFTSMHDNVMANLAGIYTDTLSTFNFRIHVTGNPIYLNNPVHTNKVRALLLAGIRSAVLWRQMGGNRWQLIFGRQRYSDVAKKVKDFHNL